MRQILRMLALCDQLRASAEHRKADPTLKLRLGYSPAQLLQTARSSLENKFGKTIRVIASESEQRGGVSFDFLALKTQNV